MGIYGSERYEKASKSTVSWTNIKYIIFFYLFSPIKINNKTSDTYNGNPNNLIFVCKNFVTLLNSLYYRIKNLSGIL